MAPPVARKRRGARIQTRTGDFRSGSEVRVAEQLTGLSCKHEYETRLFYYLQPHKVRSYRPDFILWNGIVVEVKGRFQTNDRQKHKFLKKYHPELDIRFVFDNPNAKINKGSPTTYAKWCDDYGFQYAAKLVPPEWTREDHCEARWAAIQSAQKKVKTSDFLTLHKSEVPV